MIVCLTLLVCSLLCSLFLGVISTPTVHEQELTDKDKVIVIATDGLWEFVTNTDVIDVINNSKNSQVCEEVNSLRWT